MKTLFLALACVSSVLVRSTDAQQPRTIRLPRAASTESGEVVLARLDAAGLAALRAGHRAGEPVRLLGLPLPDGRSADLDLLPTDPWEAGGTAVVVDADGRTRRMAPSLRLFRVGAGAQDGFLAITDAGVHGIVAAGGETVVLTDGSAPVDRSPGGRAGTLRITSGASLGIQSPREWCRTATRAIAPVPGSEAVSAEAGPLLRVSTVFLEVDHPLRRIFASDQEAIDYATLLVGLTDAIYRRDLGVRVTIPDGYLRVWNQPGPWLPLRPGVAVQELARWWNGEENPDARIPRTQVHALTHVAGVANPGYNWGFALGIGVLCQKRKSYAVSSLEGNFLAPLRFMSGRNADLYLFAHETGHLFGSGHTHDYRPPIECEDGSGPDRGTIMSYCYGPTGRSVAGIGMRFHPRVQRKLLARVDAVGCVQRVPIAPGDYDADGLVTPLDLAELDAYLVQGFASRGARETFDLNGDLVVDAQDRELLAAAVVHPAGTSVFNGSGINRVGYESLAPPLLGTSWTGVVHHAGWWPALSLVVGTVRRMEPPIATRFGELLIGHVPGARGGFVSLAPANAPHVIALPDDRSLGGAVLETQAVIIGLGGIELLNGVQLRLGSYLP